MSSCCPGETEPGVKIAKVLRLPCAGLFANDAKLLSSAFITPEAVLVHLKVGEKLLLTETLKLLLPRLFPFGGQNPE